MMEERQRSTMQGDRIEWLDFMKGIAIIIVVMGHISSTLVGTHAFSDLILVFEMPLFFTLSGILATRTLQRPFCINLKKKCRSLLLPFYTTGFAFALTNERVYEFLTEKYHCGYWFLLSLFFCWLVLLSLSKVVDRFTKKGFKKYAEVVLLITPYFLYHSISRLIPAEMLNVMTIDLTFLFYLFFIIGYYIGKFRILYIIPQKLGGGNSFCRAFRIPFGFTSTSIILCHSENYKPNYIFGRTNICFVYILLKYYRPYSAFFMLDRKVFIAYLCFTFFSTFNH